ncbi:hypothetical protein A8C75_09075 [Marinobacterium aestuarii]|uniref:Uncharacterized protein n=1 Tax=Marinobacterium aestuarii TaxID=1821621 RepID=A0A1A9EYK9_9GAMM|nr:hypothetical protein [Marinobacterium aestuarii]ANG62619.1 hypothetical protein A8C75_09075 [Marinobacterium aestuarii]
MNYSHRIAARFAQFPAEIDEPPYGGAGDIATLGLPGVDQIDHFMTINWVVAATDERGLPFRPYTVEVAGEPYEYAFASYPRSIRLGKANSHRWYVDSLFDPGPIRPWGILCLGLIAKAKEDGAELFCRSFDGSEIYGTRLAVDATDRKCAFFGPNIFEICASADVEISDIAAFTVTPELLYTFQFDLVASVGPAFEPQNKPSPWPYDNQSYLSLPNLSPMQALTLRQCADGLARANTLPPALQRLEDAVHRQDPNTIAGAIHGEDAVAALADHLNFYLQHPAERFEAPVDAGPSGRGTDTMSLTYAQILNLLARQGPVEALTLGNAVTIPRARKDYFIGLIRSMDAAFDLIAKGHMPYPLIRVGGQFYDAQIGALVEEFGFAGLDLPVDSLQPKSQAVDYFEPEARDKPASAAIKTRLHPNASSLIAYVSLEDETNAEQVIEERSKPRAFYPNTPDPNRANKTGAPELWLGTFDVPLTEEADVAIRLHPRDIFGRWPRRESAPCHLLPRPVGTPVLISCQIGYNADETISATVVFEWDRTIRNLQSVAFGLALSNDPPEGRNKQLKPGDGLSCPAFPTGTALQIEFDMNGAPMNSLELPAGVAIAEIPPPQPHAKLAANRSHYELTIPLGTVRDAMALRKDPALPLLLDLVADASEQVSGARRTEPPLPRLASEVRDPRPPVLDVQPWAITWTALPNGETNEARASLALPRGTGDPPAQSFNIWRSQETAVLSFALARHFANDDDVNAYLAAVRRETKPAVRLGLIQRLIEPKMKDADFMEGLSALFKANSTGTIESSDSVEIVVPAHQTGFEFVLFTANSRDGVASNKITNPCMCVVAIPRPVMADTPALRIISWDDAGYFEVAGLCMAIASYPEQFDGGHVRVFWDHGGTITDANELRFNIPVLAEMSVAEAKSYVADIEKIIRNSMPFEYNRIFLLMPPVTTDFHHFAIELQTETQADHPAAEIPTPRSQITSLYLRGGIVR